MRKALSVVAGLVVFSAAAYAVADIPTRYSGSFPSSGVVNNVSGTFTGSSLTLKYTVIRRQQFFPATSTHTCSKAGANVTACAGRFTAENGRTGPINVRITWSAGQPVATKFSH